MSIEMFEQLLALAESAGEGAMLLAILFMGPKYLSYLFWLAAIGMIGNYGGKLIVKLQGDEAMLKRIRSACKTTHNEYGTITDHEVTKKYRRRFDMALY